MSKKTVNSRVDELVSFFTRGKSAISTSDKWAQKNVPWTRRRVNRAVSPAFEKLIEGRKALEHNSARVVIKNDFQQAAKGKQVSDQRLVFEKAQERLKARAAKREKNQKLQTKPSARAKPVSIAKPAVPTKPAIQPKPVIQQNSKGNLGGKRR